MARRCSATTKTGQPCQAPPRHGSEYCYTHDPAVAEERKESQRKGALMLHYGRHGSGPRHVSVRSAGDVLSLLEMAASDLMGRKPGHERARNLVYLAVSASKVLETADLSERLEALEERLKLRAVK